MKKTIASVIAIFLSFAMFIPNLQVTFAEGNENGAVQSTEVSAEESMDVFGSETGPEISPDENGSASIQEGLPAEIQSGITEDSAASPEETGGGQETAGPETNPEMTETSEEAPQPFSREVEMEGVIIKVEADAGVFPEDAQIIVEKINEEAAAKADEAIEEVRPDKLNVAASYTFDIKVTDAEGNELQPAKGQKVKVSFALDRAADHNLSADIYHITETEVEEPADATKGQESENQESQTVYTAEKLEAETDRNMASVTAETEGFSLYTVEFTYSDLQYILAGDSSVALRDILSAVGLTGEAAWAETSAPEHFSVSGETGEWVVTSHQAFHTVEWMKVAINDIEYTITVTDDTQTVSSWGELQDRINNASDGDVIVLGSDLVCDTNTSIRVSGKSVIIDLSGHTLNRNRSSLDGDGHTFWVNDNGNLTIRDSAGGGMITGGWADSGGAIDVQAGSACTIEGGTITGNQAKYGGGVIARGTLNVTGGSITGNTATYGGGIHITEAGNGQLNFSGGSISNNKATDGGGVYIETNGRMDFSGGSVSENSANRGGGVVAHGILTMSEGSKVTENNTLGGEHGGGVYVTSEGTFTLQGGAVEKNTSQKDGGGIYSEGNVNTTGGTLSGNTAEDGGGIYNKGGTIQFDGVTVSNNTSTKYGGAGINNKGENGKLSNCTITGNQAASDGAGIYTEENIEITNCTISNNTTQGSGGALRIYDCTADVTNCTMKGNSAKGSGGAISVDNDGTLNLIGGKIEENIAYEGGSGIWVGKKGNISVSGALNVSGNTASDIYMYSGKKITIAGALEAEGNKAKIGVTLADQQGVFTSGFADNNPGKDPFEYFVPEIGCSVVLDGAEVKVIASMWGHLQYLINVANDNDVIILDRSIKADSGDGTLTVPAEKTITIDLKGFTLDRGLGSYKENGEAITVKGNLTIKDSAGGGKVTGGFGGGGGVCVYDGGIFSLESGSISGNHGNANGGGILVLQNGTATIKGSGKVESNNAPNGGGIYASGKVTVEAGSVIKGNNAYGNGGGIYLESGFLKVEGGSISSNSAAIGGGIYLGGQLNLYGGSVTENSASVEAGGIWFGGTAEAHPDMYVQGAPAVTDNHAPLGQNILLRGGIPIVIVDALEPGTGTTPGAILDLATDTPNNPLTGSLGENVSDTDALKIFTYETRTDRLEIREETGQKKIYLKGTSGTPINSWQALEEAIKASNPEDEFFLTQDINADGQDYSIKVDGKTVTVDLNGHTMDRKRSSENGDGHVFNVKGGGNLTLKDTAGTGSLTGGNATDGGGIKIEEDSSCTIDGVAIRGNKADKDGAGIYVYGTLKMTGGSITANEAGDNGGGIYVEDTGMLDLDGVLISANTSEDSGGGLNIHLRDSGDIDGTIKNCIIKGNQSTDSNGGGLNLDAHGRVLSISNTVINGNMADDKAGGIHLLSGTINMTGGELSGNSGNDAGGIMVTSDTMFVADGVTIANNQSKKGGGGVNNKGTTTLRNCTISGNRSSDDSGGGVWNKGGSYMMEGCTLNDNNAKNKGGGVFCKDDATIKNCTFTSNKAKIGGGIYVADSAVMIENPVMTKNRAENYGGAIYIDSGDVTINGGSILENDADYGGSGIYVDGKTMIMGALIVQNNERDNVYLNDEKLKIVGDVISGEQKSLIYVTYSEGFGTFTKDFKAKNPDRDPADYFASDLGYSVIRDGDGEAHFVESQWPKLQKLINDTAGTSEEIPVLTLDRDWQAMDSDPYLSLPEGAKLIIDLNGHTIDRNRKGKAKNGHVFVLGAGNSLTIKDTSEAKSGTITGGFGDNGGAFYLASSASGQDGIVLNIESGNITGNKAGNGGAIYAERSDDPGQCTINISGGSMSGNVAQNGGAIYLAENDSAGPATVNLTGGVISGNHADVEGGAIWAGKDGVLNASGMPFIKGNSAGAGNNILLGSGNVLHITGLLMVGSGNTEETIDTAALDLASKSTSGEGSGDRITEGLTTSKPDGTEDYAKAIFTYDEQNFDIALLYKDNELFTKAVVADDWVSSWKELQDYVNDGSHAGKTVGLRQDINADGEDYSIKVDGDNISNVTIELNGHKMDRKRSSSKGDGHVINVKDGASLTIKDSVGTGIITGGYADGDGGGIKIEKDSVCTIESGTISGNRTGSDGGGIDVLGKLIMTGGAVSNNYAKDTAGAIHCHSSGSFELKNVLISGNTAKNDGGALIVYNDSVIENCRILNNESETEDGGAMRVEAKNHTLTINNTVISGNRAENNGGAIVIYSGTVVMNGGTIANNTSEDGAGVYNDDGTINFTGVTIIGNTSTKKGGAGINNRSDATLTDCAIVGNSGQADGGGIYTTEDMSINGGIIAYNSASGDGGGIFNDGDGTTINGTTIANNKTEKDGGAIFTTDDMTLTGCTLQENQAKVSGGGIRVKDCTVKLENSTLKDNEAVIYGGGIYINDGDAELELSGGSITGNSSDQAGGGIYVDDGTDHVRIEGNVNIYDNIGGSDVYLTKGKRLEVTGPLSSGEGEGKVSARIGVFTVEGLNKEFTSDYSKHNKDGDNVIDPALYFFSDEEYKVYLKDGEAAFMEREIDNSTPFVEKESQVDKDYNQLNGANWMSGLSGERYLHEVNMPGSHDSGTKKMVGNVTTGYISMIAAGAGALIGLGLAMMNPATLFLGGVSLIGGMFGGSVALEDIAADYQATFAETQRRYIDEQLKDGVRSLDMRVCNYYAQEKGINKDNGKDLYILHGKDKMPGTFFAKNRDGDFLTFSDVLEDCKDFLSKHPTETIILDVASQGIGVDEEECLERLNQHFRNLAMELNPATGKSYIYTENGDYTAVLTHYPQLKDCRGQIIISGETVGKGTGGLNTGVGLSNVYRPEGSFKDNAEHKIQHLTNFYNVYGFDPLPADAKQTLDYYYSVGTNGTDEKKVPTITPLEIAAEVLPVLFDEGGLLLNREGRYLGLVNMDDTNSKNNRQVWITNFGSLNYCTVTSKESADDPNPKTYTVLENTTLPIPECIYNDPNNDGNYFQYWKAEWTENGEARTDLYYPGDQFTVTGDVTFTAIWEQTDNSMVRAVWNDADNADGIRPNRLTVKVIKQNASGGETAEEELITLSGGKNWRESLNYEVTKAEPVLPEGFGYTAEVKGTKIILTHKPDRSVLVKGSIDWRDDENSGGKRPAEVTLGLYKNGVQIKELTVKAQDNWNYDFIDQVPLYDMDEAGNITKNSYTLTQSEVEEYSTYVGAFIEEGEETGFRVINTLEAETSILNGLIIWADDDNEAEKRPDKIIVRLQANGAEVASQEVVQDGNGDWLFAFPLDQEIPYSGYSVIVDAIEGYETKVQMGQTNGDYAYVVNTLNNHIHTEIPYEVINKAPTCEEAGEQTRITICVSCSEILDFVTSPIAPLGHTWSDWKTKKTATETEDGLEERVCSRDPDHVESRLVPKTAHVHNAVSVPAKEATCTEDGNIAYYYCESCGWYFTDSADPEGTWLEHGDEVLPALGHDFGEWTVVKEATETEEGLEERTCSHDGSHKESRVLPVIGHSHGLAKVEAKAATCSEAGNIEYWVCTEGDHPCGKYFSDAEGTTVITEKDVIVPALGHDWKKWKTVKEATETETGLEQRICRNDPNHVETRIIPKKLHEHEPIFVPAKAPTCTADGNKAYYYCEDCGWYFLDGAHPGTTWIAHGDEVLPALGHEWGAWTVVKEATEMETGLEQRICMNDPSHVEERMIPKTLHVHEPIFVPAKAPTCTADGNKAYYYCAGCGWYFLDGAHPGTTWIAHGDEVLPALGHDYGEWTVVKAATETEEGLEERTCLHDASHKESRTIPVTAHQHKLSKVEAKAATCTEAGNIEYWVCTEGENPCGKYFSDAEGTNEIEAKDVILPALGHDYGDPVYEWAADNSICTGRRICLNDASHVIEKTVTVSSVVTKEPTATEPGERTFTAVFEGEEGFTTQTKTEAIPPVGLFMIKFDLGGGNYNGNSDPLIIFAAKGDVITIPDAPIKEGYKFLYWKGSEYYPGDKYTVTGDHIMTAQWEKITEPAKDDKGVRTDDSNNILFWIVAMFGALLAVSVSATVIMKRKERSRRSSRK